MGEEKLAKILKDLRGKERSLNTLVNNSDLPKDIDLSYFKGQLDALEYAINLVLSELK